MSPFFIKHPIIAAVIAIVTTMLGVISITSLPISQYPDITPITIQLSATYPGANAQQVADSVASPIELQLSGLEGMDYMNSTSSNNGSCSINVVFAPGTDANTAQQLTYQKYAQATSQLPGTVSQMGVTIKQSSGLPLMMYALDSPEGFFNPIDLTGYAYINLVDPVKRVEGVGDVMVFGGRYAVRIWLDSEKMAQKGISVSEVYNAVNSQNTINPGGSVGAEPMPDGQEFTFTVRNKGRMESIGEFGDIIVSSINKTQIVRLKDISKIELGSQSYSLAGRVNGQPATALAIYQSANANALETSDRLHALFAEKEKIMPEGMHGFIALDTTTTVRDSINEIFVTLIEALVLVAIVVFVFLQGWRATLIPLIAVPVSLVTTFCFFPILGFTLNTICLLGMVLAIGLVVDDAIVVVEAVEAHMESGMSARQATFAAMKEVSGPVVAIALVLAAVFLPSVLLPGITGTLFQQFAVTIAVSMLISAFNALTLSPALSALLLKPKSEHKSLLSPLYNLFNKCYDKVADAFAASCAFLCRRLWLSLPMLALLTAAIIPVSQRVPGGFLPDEDQGFLIAGVIMKPGVSLQRLTEQSATVEKIIMADPALDVVTSIIGMNLVLGVQTTNALTYFVTLKPYDERPMVSGKHPTAIQVQQRLNAALAVSGVDGYCFTSSPPAIPGVGTGNGVSVVVEDLEGQGVAALYEQMKKYEAELEKDPAIAAASDMMLPQVPQKHIAIDIDKCLAQGVDYGAANALLQCFNGSSFVNYYTQFGQQWQVYLQAAGVSRTNTDQIANFYVSNNKGESVPLSTLVTINDIADTEFVYHMNNYNSGKISITPSAGYSSAQAMAAAERIFNETMDTTKFAMEYVDMSFQEKKVQDGLGLGAIFTLSGVFAFLIMAALYEKWTLPLAIFLSVPVAVLGAFLGLWAYGLELNLYAQIGLVMLVGLAAKNAILIVEYAVLQMERGKSLQDAAVIAARMRLRPILMTSFAFILGCVPLLTAEGAGALARNAIGVVVVIGMSVATLVGVFFIPCAFVFIMRLFRSKIGKPRHGADPDETEAYARLEAEEEAATQS